MDRLPFAEGKIEWKQYLTKLRKEEDVRYLLMEFVKGDSIDQFVNDVDELRTLIN